MKITKAIEILADDVRFCSVGFDPDLVDAINLGIEALKFRLRVLEILSLVDLPSLPGEDPE